jgi:polyhydroxybutyrate depolymerase
MRPVAVATLLGALLFLCSGGASPRLTPGVRARSLVLDGTRRYYDVYVPRGYDGATPVPLVLDFHGQGLGKTAQREQSSFRELADAKGFIVGYPLGLFGDPNDAEAPHPSGGHVGPSWNANALCCGAASAAGVDDVGFARALVAAIAAEANVDRRRVYATGFSNGAALAHRLGCDAADTFAAVAPMAFPLLTEPFTTCRPSRPMPVIYFAGVVDGFAPFEGRGVQLSAADTFAYWRKVNGCGDGSPEREVATGSIECRTDTSCTAGVRVALCAVTGSGHGLYADSGLPLAEVAWEFFSHFSLPAAPAPVEGRPEASASSGSVHVAAPEDAIDRRVAGGACGLRNPPECNGACPEGRACVDVADSCVCALDGLAPCLGSGPQCNGSCPPGQACRGLGGYCACR